MLNHLAPVAVPQPKLPETRQPTGTLANHGLTSVDLAILSGATLQEGPPRNLSQSHGITTLFRRIVSFFYRASRSDTFPSFLLYTAKNRQAFSSFSVRPPYTLSI
jgi:hypothetical protein